MSNFNRLNLIRAAAEKINHDADVVNEVQSILTSSDYDLTDDIIEDEDNTPMYEYE